MATYNSINYAPFITPYSAANANGVNASQTAQEYVDGKRQGGNTRSILVQFDTTVTNLAIGDIINVCVLPTNCIPVSIQLGNDAAVTSGTVQMGITGTAAYFSAAALSIGTANTRAQAFTKVANYGKELAVQTTVIATIAGAAVSTAQLFFEVTYLAN